MREVVTWYLVWNPGRFSEWSVLRCGERRARAWGAYRASTTGKGYHLYRLERYPGGGPRHRYFRAQPVGDAIPLPRAVEWWQRTRDVLGRPLWRQDRVAVAERAKATRAAALDEEIPF